MPNQPQGISILILWGLLTLTACQRQQDNTPSSKTWTVLIGSATPLSGPQAHLGLDSERGAQLAIEAANAQHLTIQGHLLHFELISKDDAADPRTATIVAQQLVDDQVNGIVGHMNSGTTIPASHIYHEAQIVQISPSATNPKYTHQGFNTAFRLMANDYQQGRVLSQFAMNQLNAHAIAVIDDSTAYGQGLANEFIRALDSKRTTLIAQEHADDHSTDFTALLTRLKSRHPDLIFYGGMDAQSGPLVHQMRRLEIPALFLTGDGGCTPEFAQLASDSANNTYCSSPGLPLENMPKGPSFQATFEKRFGPIQDYAPYSYDAVSILIRAMITAQSLEPTVYLKVLQSIHYEGVTANIRFDTYGDLKDGSISLYQWQNGKKQFVVRY
ncbi:MAG: branched-chain amino acid ABC transporter substrate-binding protein [Ferrovum sp.]|nr:branched-chain amino acid ABC transporter substrate-binding protein [Ferrovum sp.]